MAEQKANGIMDQFDVIDRKQAAIRKAEDEVWERNHAIDIQNDEEVNAPVTSLSQLLDNEPEFGIVKHYISHEDGKREEDLTKFWHDLTEPEKPIHEKTFTAAIEGDKFILDVSRTFKFNRQLLTEQTRRAIDLFKKYKDSELLAILQLNKGNKGILTTDESLPDVESIFNSINNIEVLATDEDLMNGKVFAYDGDLPNGSIEIHSHGENLKKYHDGVSIGDIITAIEGNPWVDANGTIYKDLRVFGVVTVSKNKEGQKLSLQIYKIDLKEMHKVIMSMEDNDPKGNSLKHLGVSRWGTAVDL